MASGTESELKHVEGAIRAVVMEYEYKSEELGVGRGVCCHFSQGMHHSSCSAISAKVCSAPRVLPFQPRYAPLLVLIR